MTGRLRVDSATFSVEVVVSAGPTLDMVGDVRRVKVGRLHYERDLATGEEFLTASGTPTTGRRGADEATVVIPDDERAEWLSFCRLVAAGGYPKIEHHEGEHP